MKSRRTRRISNNRPGVTRPVPRRTCVACRRIRAKQEMIRLVRTHGGDIEIDTGGKKEGRGAYICPDPACWERALKGKQLEHTLRANLTPDSRERLVRSGKDLLKESVSA